MLVESKVKEKSKKELIEKVMQKREFSQLPLRDVEKAFEKFDKKEFSDEDKVKKTRDFLRRIFSGFGGKKLLGWKEKSANYVLEKHLSTKERYAYYEEVYERILKKLPKKINIVDLGAGVNGLSYSFFEKVGKDVNYVGIEAIGQLVDLVNGFFGKENIKGEAIHLSLFEKEKVKEIINKQKKPRIVFMFKVVDALEKFERDYTKKLLEEIVPLCERVIISFATESWIKRKKFYVQRKWLTEFIEKDWKIIDDFEINGERYIVVEK